MTTRRFLLGVYALLVASAERGREEVDELLDADMGYTPLAIEERAGASLALGGEVA